jgi:hypothetical protein
MHAYPKHLDAFDYLGPHRYFLTFCTYERQPLFHIAAHVALVESQFLQTAKSMGFADLAHCSCQTICTPLSKGATRTRTIRPRPVFRLKPEATSIHHQFSEP